VKVVPSLTAIDRHLEFYVMRCGGRMAFSGVFLLYVFQGNVLAFFGLGRLSKKKAIGKLVGICVAIGGVTMAITLLSG